MNYEYEFSRLFDTVDQYVKSKGTSKAAKQALLNAYEFYTANLKSSNSDYTKCELCGSTKNVTVYHYCDDCTE